MKITVWNVISYSEWTSFTTNTFTKKADAEAELRLRIEKDWSIHQDKLGELPFPDSVDDAIRTLNDLDGYDGNHRLEDVDLDFTTAKVSRREIFSPLEMEAALCSWEWMLENVKHPVFKGIWEGLGYAAMRACATQAGTIVLAVYDHMTDLDYEFVTSYDWEFVPAVLELIDWKKLSDDNQYAGPIYQPDVPAMFRDMLTERPDNFGHRDPKTTWLNQARHAAKRLWEYPELLTDHPDLFELAFEEGLKPNDFVEELGRDLNLTPKGH
ncbi:hypothetical protein C3Y94_025985 [Rhizobium ruizarguesonis]|uniref:hypothetical protein n=1 Tax=Rhizobium ruizarguesonis TaxID=2081791 RepID=UPI00163A7323|nr:hypothetical protein [Rhizobium ruizarguesonis]MBC2806605.1 hypothetical protein [Rhizobium ruizarguesonis]